MAQENREAYIAWIDENSSEAMSELCALVRMDARERPERTATSQPMRCPA